MKDIVNPLQTLADHLDKKGLSKEADFADEILLNIAGHLKAEQKKAMDMESMDEMDETSDEETGCDHGEEESCAACAPMQPKMDANQKAIFIRRRARARRLLLKNS